MKSPARPAHYTRSIGLGALLALSSAGSAADFYPITAIGTNMTDGNPGANPLSNVIEGPGVGFAATEPHDAIGGVWYTDAPGGFPSDYIEVHPGPEYLWFDLGMDVALSEISFWGYSTGNSNGVRGFNVSFATDAEGGAAGLGDEEYGSSITANPAFEAVLDNIPRQSFEFAPVIARYVRVEVTSTHITNGGAGGPDGPAGGDRVGVGEFAFEESMIPPDPQISVPAEVVLDLDTSVAVFDVQVLNVGGAELSITGASLVGPNEAAFSVSSTPSTIPSLGSDVITVRFDPTGLVGPVSATLEITSNDGDTSPAEVLLSGTVPPTEPDIIVPDPIDRGTLLGLDVFDVVVTNGGGTELTITGASFTGPNEAAFSVLDAPTVIPALSDEAFQIQIDPSGLDGPISATLQIESDDPDTSTAEVEISAISLGDATQFYPIVNVQSSTAADDFFPVENLIQGPGVGFDAEQPHDKLADGAEGLWVTAACGFPCDYIDTTGMPVLVFDLGQNVPLCEISVWGYSATNSNGVSEFSLQFATEADGPDGFGSSISFNPTFGGIGSGEFPNVDATSRFSFPFEEAVTARYVEFTCVDNHFIAPGDGSQGEIPGGDRVGLGEVAFAILDCETPSLFFDVEADGDDLVLTWESVNGELYNVRSETNPASVEPIMWPIFDGHEDIVATPPLNTLTIPRPTAPFRLFVIESFPTPPVSVFADNFENGQGSWTTGSDGEAGTTWELGEPGGAVGPGSSNSPTNSFGTNLTSAYAVSADVWLRSPAIDLTNAAEATLIYSQFYDIEPSFDSGSVSVLDASDDSQIAELVTELDGTAADWENVRRSLPPEALGKSIKIEFRLQTDDFDASPFAGFYIDDVEVTVR